VGGPAALIEQLLTNDRIEAIAIDPNESTWRIEEGVQALVDAAINDLMDSGESTLTTSRGIVNATLVRAGKLRKGEFRYTTIRPDGGSGSGMTPLRSDDPDAIRSSMTVQLTSALISLVGG
jgi:hypothetical protein